jgi:hypothetical protein
MQTVHLGSREESGPGASIKVDLEPENVPPRRWPTSPRMPSTGIYQPKHATETSVALFYC